VPLSIAVLTVSDTRSLAEDRSGDTLVDRLTKAGTGSATVPSSRTRSRRSARRCGPGSRTPPSTW
jgi:molybdopterin biosynthesis enzyme MoaB